MHVSMHFCDGRVHRTRPSTDRRFSSLPACSSSCSQVLVSVFSLPELFSPHSIASTKFCARFCNFLGTYLLLSSSSITVVLPSFTPPVDCAPKPSCRGRVPRRPGWLVPLAAGGLVTLCSDLRSASPLVRCLRASSRVQRAQHT